MFEFNTCMGLGDLRLEPPRRCLGCQVAVYFRDNFQEGCRRRSPPQHHHQNLSWIITYLTIIYYYHHYSLYFVEGWVDGVLPIIPPISWDPYCPLYLREFV